MKKFVIAVILSAALIGLAPEHDTPVNNLGSKAAITKPAGQVHHTVTAPAQEVKQVETPAPQDAKTQPEITVAVTPPKQVPQGCAAYVPLLQQYAWNYQVMAAVMQAESGCVPTANNQGIGNYDHIPDFGLMQLHGQEIYDPATNIAHAYAIWQSQGYHAWSVYTSGAYLKYL